MRYVFALGGNAFGKKNIDIAAGAIVRIWKEGNEVLVTHGNGPQVGALYLREGKNLAILTRETEHELGCSIRKALLRRRADTKVDVFITKVLVDGKDPEFLRPTKPIGEFYSREEDVPKGKRNFAVRKLGKGYRLVVPSPVPMDIIGTEKIDRMLSEGKIVIAAGGGGEAVIRSYGRLRPADAVIDKDFASALLARKMGADRLFILTDVDGAYVHFGTRRQKLLLKTNVSRMRDYLGEGQFEEGSMMPKVKACIEFVESTGGIAAIGNIARIGDVVRLKSTVVLP